MVPSNAAHHATPARTALLATLHCLAGCSIGEVAGMVLGSALGWHGAVTVIASIVLAFVFGYSLTLRPLIAGGIPLRRALGLAFASDTASITVMEIIDNLTMLVVPGAMTAGLHTGLFWGSMATSLVLAGLAAYPVNLWLVKRGLGHAVVHGAHSAGHGAGAGKDAGGYPSADPHAAHQDPGAHKK